MILSVPSSFGSADSAQTGSFDHFLTRTEDHLEGERIAERDGRDEEVRSVAELRATGSRADPKRADRVFRLEKAFFAQDLHISFPGEAATDRPAQLVFIQLQLLANTVLHRHVAGTL